MNVYNYYVQGNELKVFYIVSLNLLFNQYRTKYHTVQLCWRQGRTICNMFRCKPGNIPTALLLAGLLKNYSYTLKLC